MIKTTLTKQVLEKYPNPYFLETGTAYGDCVRLALELNFEKIFSIEIDPFLQNQNTNCYKQAINENKLTLITGDSLQEIINLIPKLDKPTTFWLDAHVDDGPSGIKKCPLYEELIAIKTSRIKIHTILIDDMRCIGRGNWGEGITIESLKKYLLEINPEYKFTYEHNTCALNDILVAHI